MPRTPSIFVLFLLLLATTHTAFAATTIPGGTLEVSGSWTKEESPYIITGTLTIPAGRALTINPGAIVKIAPDIAPFTVEGILMMGSADSEQVTITSLKDDTVGGDSNNDSEVTTPGAGDWRTITVSPSGQALITNTTIRYGGSSLYAPWMGGYLPRPSLENNDGALSLTNVLLSESGNNGIEQISGSTTITNSTFSTITQKGILSRDGDLSVSSSTWNGMQEGIVVTGGRLTIEGNIFHNLSTGNALSLEGTLTSFTNNGGNKGDGVISLGLLLPSTFTLSPDGLPYSPRYLDVGVGQTLTILPGAVIAMKPTSLFRISGGTLIVGGEGEQVTITSILDASSWGGIETIPPHPGDWGSIQIDPLSTVSFTNTLIRYGGREVYDGALGGLRSDPALENNGGTLTIDKTTMSDNESYALRQTSGTTTIMHSEIARTHAYGIAKGNGSFSIHSSSIHDNGTGIANFSPTLLDATENWWGSASGPTHPSNPGGMGDRVEGNVDYGDWFGSDPLHPDTPTCAIDCHSSVLFLPGLQSSRLYRPDYDGGTDRLWEPNGNADVRDLFMDENGESIRDDIYTKDVLDEAFGIGPDVYKGFLQFLAGLKTNGTIADYTALPYDWRYALHAIISRGLQYPDGRITFEENLGATSTPIITQELRRLAATSRTGKVTIITHSNGGLVAKALLASLGDEESSRLVDQLIMIGAPQLGTPKAIAGLLHGEGQEYGWGYIMNKGTARLFARNLPGAYQLIPSAAYSEVVHDPVVIIRNTPSTAALYGAYGPTVDTPEELTRFLVGEEGRIRPVTVDHESPETLLPGLLEDAAATHALIDAWTPPADITVTQIAGWGRETIKGIRYTDYVDAETGLSSITYVPLMTVDGDETVVVPSALALATSTENVRRLWVNLYDLSDEENRNIKHANFTESEYVQNIISRSLLNSDPLLPKFITLVSPATTTRHLRFTLHSPLSLGFTDNEGRYTGLATTTAPDMEYPRLIEDIPNSYYAEYGDLKILGLGEATGTLTLIGESSGTFTLDVESFSGDETTGSTTFPELPTATGTIVTLSLADTTHLPATLSLDYDGNGTTDLSVSNEGLTDVDTLTLLRLMLSSLDLKPARAAHLENILTKIDKAMAKEFKNEEKKSKRLTTLFDRLDTVIERLHGKGKITDGDAGDIRGLIESIKERVVQ